MSEIPPEVELGLHTIAMLGFFLGLGVMWVALLSALFFDLGFVIGAAAALTLIVIVEYRKILFIIIQVYRGKHPF